MANTTARNSQHERSRQRTEEIERYRNSRIRPCIDWAFLVLDTCLRLDYLVIRTYLFCYRSVSRTARIGDSGIMHQLYRVNHHDNRSGCFGSMGINALIYCIYETNHYMYNSDVFLATVICARETIQRRVGNRHGRCVSMFIH